MATLKAGDLLHITRAASPQFVTSFHFRVIRVLDWTTFDGWMWLDGYQLDERGDALARRSIFVMQGGLKPGSIPSPRGMQAARRA
ncbi:hypothetical protein [Micromonospora sp. CNB394]|uniref:hypothetical protein n=1 Tax=Micromonospora sp. CNB394 TaxID=1169151 RepID=UPI000378B4B1|nr:hypothetical protein [Micromonospora sp. CNB394]